MGTASSRYEDTVHFTNKAKSYNPKSKPSSSREDDDDVFLEQEADDGDVYQTDVYQPDGGHKQPKIEIDQIDQEQARQDLMAYLDIVGENADDLPITWRDDPELGATVSTLTAKQYAKKSDAFIPCDVRVIASTCTKYGNLNKGLPNKEVRARSEERGFVLFNYWLKQKCNI